MTCPFFQKWSIGVLITCFMLGGCSKKTSPTPAQASSTSPTVLAHDPAHPPIDCPLHKQGIDPTRLRPFAEVDQYIAFLERADRAVWQKPDAVVGSLDLRGNEVIFDLGAGSGYFSFRFAAAVPNGKVIAADTEAEMVRHVHHRILSEGLRNVEARLIQPAEPGVSPDTDLVFICDVLHHVPERRAWMSKLAAPMKLGSRLVLIEFKEGKLPEGPPESAKIKRAELVSLVTGAGFVLDQDFADLLPYQVFLVFTKR